MKLSSLVLTLALLPAAVFAANGNSGGGSTSSPSGPTVIPGGVFATSYVISAPGSYVLGGNRSTDSSLFVIQIAAPDVTLDLNGYSLSNYVGASAAGGGVSVPTPENVEIRNGSILNAPNYAIRAMTGKGVRVIDVRVAGAGYAGIYIEAAAAQIDRCHVSDCVDYGIWANGGGALVTDCVVNGSANASGVSVLNGARVVRTNARGCKYGITVFSSSAVDCSATGNYIGFFMSDSATLRGVDCIKNTSGVFTNDPANVIMSSRITSNTANFSTGIYTNGGGNVIQ